MAWLLFILFLLFALVAAYCFRQGRPQPAILALAACTLFLSGIFLDYWIVQRGIAEEAVAAAPAAPDTAPVEAPAAPSAEPPPEEQASPELDNFYSDTSSDGSEPMDSAAPEDFESE